MIYSNIEIKRIRKNNGLTQKSFANSLGVTINSVQKWESGDRTPTKEMWFFIRSLYNIDISDEKKPKEEFKGSFKNYNVEKKLNVIYEVLETIVENTKDLKKEVDKNKKIMFQANFNQLENNAYIQQEIDEINEKSKGVRKLS